MRVLDSSNAVPLPVSPAFQRHMLSVSESELRAIVSEIAVPRHARSNADNNKSVAEWICSQLSSFGYDARLQGHYSNVLALNPNLSTSDLILVGAHFDSVPDCPGADDNASAVAALLVCAKIVSRFAPDIPVCFAAFNCEEDGLIGSRNFVYSHLPASNLRISQAHVLEMIGYATDSPNSQLTPAGLPVKIPETGNFLGILGNEQSLHLVDNVLALGKTYLPDYPLTGLKLFAGAERLVPDLARSDHVAFWEKEIPALMWTDTADFRNPNYHKATDTPDTLNYNFLKRATQLLLLQVLDFGNAPQET